MARTLALLAALLAGHVLAAPPTVYFPLNSQLPPVARLGEPFSFTPSPQTFTSAAPATLEFSLSAPTPKWLSIDAKTGRLYGTPRSGDLGDNVDVVGVAVEVVASDSEGSATMEATLVVSRNRPPAVQVPIESQIASFGDFSAPSTLLSYSSTKFSYTFSPETFSHQGPINYYATSANGSPLPSWVGFDPKTLTFAGTTPPSESLVQPPEVFSFQLVASDVLGFGATRIYFSIAIGVHKLTTENEVVTIGATRTKELLYTGLMDTMTLDGKKINKGDITVYAEDAPAWLSVSNDTFEIRGTPPQSATSANFTLNFRDEYADVLAIDILIAIQTDVFSKAIPAMTIAAGKDLDLDLSSYFWDPADVTVQVETQPASNWLSVNHLKLLGKVPDSGPAVLKVALDAKSRKLKMDEVQEFSLSIEMLPPAVGPTRPLLTPTSAVTSKRPSLSASTIHSTTYSSGPPRTVGPRPTGDSKNDPSEPTHTGGTTPIDANETSVTHRNALPAGSVAAAVIAPIAAIALFLALFFCLRRRRQRRRKDWEDRLIEISNPITNSLTVNGFSDSSRLPSAHDIAKPFGTPGPGLGVYGVGPSAFGFGDSPPSLPEYRPELVRRGDDLMRNFHASRTVTSFTSDIPPEYLSPDVTIGYERTRSASDDIVREERRSWLARDHGTLKGKLGYGARLKPRAEPLSQVDLIDFFNANILPSQRDEDFFTTSGSISLDQSSIQHTPPNLVYRNEQAAWSGGNLSAPSIIGMKGTNSVSAMSSSEALPQLPAPSISQRTRPHTPLPPPITDLPARPKTPAGDTPQNAATLPVPVRVLTPERPMASADEGYTNHDVSPENDDHPIRYVQRPRQARLSSQQFPSRQLSRRAPSSTSSLGGSISSASDRISPQNPAGVGVVSAHRSRISSMTFNRDSFARQSRIMPGGAEPLGNENWTTMPRNSLCTSYGESYSQLVADIPHHPSRATYALYRNTASFSGPATETLTMRGLAGPLGTRELARASSQVLARISSSSEDGGIGTAVSRYSRTATGLDLDFGPRPLGEKENSGLTIKTTRTEDSGIMAFL